MASREIWAELVAEVRKAALPFASPAVGRLYQVARDTGLSSLARRYERALDERVREDIVSDVLASKLNQIVAPDIADPRAFFLTAIERRAIDYLRQEKQRRSKDSHLSQLAEQRQATSGGEDDRLFFLDGRRALNTLPERERELVVAIALGDDREEVARRFAISRANVDQKLSRLRKKLQGTEA